MLNRKIHIENVEADPHLTSLCGLLKPDESGSTTVRMVHPAESAYADCEKCLRSLAARSPEAE